MAKKKNGGKTEKRPAGAQKAAKAKEGKPGGALSVIIDPYLMAGNKTVKEIAEELAKKGGEAAKGKDLAANVRARLVAYTRKGWKVQKDEQKRVKVVQP